MEIRAPYPWFGGKSQIMFEVWGRLGDTYNFVDPFLGSNAPLLSRPEWDWGNNFWKDDKSRIETVNDKDCFVSNFQRAVAADPGAVAHWADWPINEADLHARHLWLVEQVDFVELMMTDPGYFDAKVAGWWVWGLGIWIGGEWCKVDEDRVLGRQLPHLGRGTGKGIHTARVRSVSPRKRPNLRRLNGVHSNRVRNVPHRRSPHLLRPMGIHSNTNHNNLIPYFTKLSARLRRVRVCCGDWSRVLGPTPTWKTGLTAVILDPPYGIKAKRKNNLYSKDSLTVADDVRDWALANGDNPLLRIALFGYVDEHADEMPDTWECLAWKARGGYSNQGDKANDNNTKERVWFSPHCLKPQIVTQLSLLG